MERIVPIYDDSVTPPEKNMAGGTLADLIICILSALAGVIGLGYSILFFMRFLENDAHFWGALSAFILCFGVGAFAYIPASLMSVIGWRAHKKGRIKRDLIWALALILPWVLLSVILVFVSDLQKIYSVLLLILTIILLIWTLISLRSKA